MLVVHKALQRAVALDYASGPGVFGPRTRKAYAAWQRRCRVPASGLPEFKSLKMLGDKYGFRVQRAAPPHAIGWSPAGRTYYAHGYRYVLPQVGRYEQVADGSSRPLRWSYIGVDRSGARRSLMMGEYSKRGQPAARLVWWTFELRSRRLATGAGGRKAAALARACSDERYLQGCSSHNALAGRGTVWLSRSSGDHALCERPVQGGKGTTRRPWADQPEGLTYAPASDNLWCVTERPGARAVFAVKRAEL